MLQQTTIVFYCTFSLIFHSFWLSTAPTRCRDRLQAIHFFDQCDKSCESVCTCENVKAVIVCTLSAGTQGECAGI